MDNENLNEVAKVQPDKTWRFFSFGKSDTNHWPEGNDSFDFKISDTLRNIKEGMSEVDVKKVQAFNDYGTIPLYSSDGFGLIALGVDLIDSQYKVTMTIEKR